MSQLKQILRVFSQAIPIRGITRETDISRNTIKGYFRTIKDFGFIGLEHLRMEHVFRSPLKTERERQQVFLFRLEKLYKELKHSHITTQLFWLHAKESIQEDIYIPSYTIICIFIIEAKT